MHPRCCRPVAGNIVPEDGQNNYPKHVELNGIIKKSLLLHLVGCLYYLYQCCTVKQITDKEIYLLIKYVIKSVLWKVEKRLSYTEDARCLKVNAPCQFTPLRNFLSLSVWCPLTGCFLLRQSLIYNGNIIFYITPNFSRTQLGRGTRAGCIWNLSFSQQWLSRLLSSRMLRRAI